MTRKTFIYALTCPDTNEVKYVGKADRPQGRYREHINQYEPSPTRKSNWIKSVLVSGKKPGMVILEEVSIDEWKSAEKRWIEYYRLSVGGLTNRGAGGEGAGSKTSKTSKSETTKVWAVTRNLAKILAAHYDLSLVELFHRLVTQEIERKRLAIK